MKTKMVFIALAILWSSVQVINAQEKEYTVYNYAMSVGKTTEGGKSKVLVSDIQTATMNKSGYEKPTADRLKDQWQKQLVKMDISTLYLSYIRDFSDWDNNYDRVNDEREEKIASYKRNGFEIVYIVNFSFRQKSNNY